MARLRSAFAALLVVVLAGTLSACGGLNGTDGANFVVDAAIVQIAPADRTDPVDIAGPSLDDKPVNLADLRGGVVVLNVWGSWCVPCRKEAPVLREAAEQLTDVTFLGMSFRESSFDNARSFERQYGTPYPTIADTGAGVLALGRYAPISPPTTYVLDTLGRVAAVITGEVTSAGTIEDLVTEVMAENG